MAKTTAKKSNRNIPEHVVVIRISDGRVSDIPLSVFNRASYIKGGYKKASAEEIKQHFEPVEEVAEAKKKEVKEQKKEAST